MMVHVSNFAWLLTKFVGVLLLCAAIFLYEDEEGAIQSRIEEWGKSVTDKRNSSLSASASFIRGVARLTRIVLNKVFGVKAVSFQMLVVSFYLSLASLFLFSVIDYHDHALHLRSPFPTKAILDSLWFIGLALIPALAPFRWLVIIWYVTFISGFLSILPFAYYAYNIGHGKLVFGTFAFFGLAFIASLLCYMIYVFLIRWLLTKISAASTNSQVYHGLLVGAVCIVLVLMLLTCSPRNSPD